MTIFEDALSKAGIDVQAARLAVSVNNILARSNVQPVKALAQFVEVLQTDLGLLRAIAADYLMRRAADMRGESLIGGCQSFGARERHGTSALAGQSVGSDEGQTARASAKACPPSSPPPKADCEGQSVHAPRAIEGSPSQSAPNKRSLDAILADCVHDGRSQGANVARPQVATSVVKPVNNPPRGFAAMASVQHVVARSVMDTFRVRGGTPIGDLGWSEAKALARTNEIEARVLRYVTDHVANAEPGARVRDVVKVSVVEDAIRLAREAENAAA